MRILLLAAVVVALVVIVLLVLGYRRWVADRARSVARWEMRKYPQKASMVVDIVLVSFVGKREKVYDRNNVAILPFSNRTYHEQLSNAEMAAYERCLTLNAVV